MNKKSKLPLIMIAGCCFAWPTIAGDDLIYAARFTQGKLSGWESKSFQGETRYQLKNDALCAESYNSASARYRKIRIDLKRTPWLNWRWKVDTGIEPDRQETTKMGDDYPARLYVVFSGGLRFWNSRAINYVWSSSQPLDASWANAFTANAQMLAVQSGSEKQAQWQQQRRNVAADYKRLFGDEPGTIDAVAIMTDTDNSHSSAAACYGDIWFSAD